jgi:methionyl-tRNA formyltransferase
MHDGHVLKIYRSTVAPGRVRGIPGTVLVEQGKLFVMAADHPLEVLDLQQEGRKRMTAAEFLRGYTFAPAVILS